mmetsp:Transcript_30689/g.37351  ORF Transcript_30689/g.37351 Transcript_30689/m.37351 type:complete len:80 (+) Transcript_30689:77-316(+)
MGGRSNNKFNNYEFSIYNNETKKEGYILCQKNYTIVDRKRELYSFVKRFRTKHSFYVGEKSNGMAVSVLQTSVWVIAKF